MELPIDKETGQEYFKPVICRGPMYDRNRSDIEVHEFLYNYKKKPVLPVEYPFQPVDMSSTNRSSKILQRAKIERYFEIFQNLNPDSNGEISAESIYSPQLDTKVLKIIQPLLQELQAINQTLNFGDFCESMDNLTRTLTTVDKNQILLKHREKTEQSSQRKSKSVTNYDRTGLYDRHLQSKQLTEIKITEEKVKKSQNEVESCTFRPKIKYYNPNKYSY